MILGIGSDLIDVRRIERTIERHGERFLERIFTPIERAKAEGRTKRVETYAKRFAAKEACAKALGTGLRAGVFWRDMGVVNLPSGRPTMTLTGGALARSRRTRQDDEQPHVGLDEDALATPGSDPLELLLCIGSAQDSRCSGPTRRWARRGGSGRTKRAAGSGPAPTW